MTPAEARIRPVCQVQLIGCDGNAFAIIATCTKAARRAGWTWQEIADFQGEALSGDYDHVLQTAMKWFDVS
jgi:hypothetical protein